MKSPLVSVIVPVFNCGRYIGDALKSAFGQDYSPIEVIVVDDGSTDNTAEIVRTFSNINYIHQSNQGVAAARNAGVAIAQGELIAFLDADDLWTMDKLKKQVIWLQEHPDIGYVTARFRNFLEEGIKRPFWLKEEHLAEDQNGGVPNLVVRKSVLDKIGVFNAECRSGSDLDWVLRARDAKIGSAILPYTLLYRRIHDTNLSYKWRGGRSLLLKSLKASIDRQRSMNNIKDTET